MIKASNKVPPKYWNVGRLVAPLLALEVGHHIDGPTITSVSGAYLKVHLAQAHALSIIMV
jgi:hypothetical protein